MTSLVVMARRAYKFFRSFEFEGFTIYPVAGFIPFPAPKFRRKRAVRSRARRSRRSAVVRAEPPKDPVSHTLDTARLDALDEGDYWVALGAALAQNWYEQGKKGSSTLP